jgi:hypothetical protein
MVVSPWGRLFTGRCGHQLGLELFLGHAGLLRTDVLHVQPEDAGELGQVVGVAAGGHQLQHVAWRGWRGLLLVQAVLAHVGLFVGQEGGAVGGSLNEKHILFSA